MKTTFTLLLALLAFTTFAQQNFVPGFYITHQGEKVEVQINDQNWDKNPTYIKITGSSGITRLSAADIKGFELSTGDVYEAYVVDVDKSPTKLNDIQPNAQPIIERDTVFLRAIVKGAVSLYYLRDNDAKEHYFFSKGKKDPVELIYRTVRFNVEGKTGYSKLPIYKGILSTELADCPNVSGKIEQVGYNLRSLRELITDYNQCVNGSKGDYIASEEGIKWQFAAIAGLSYGTLAITAKDKEALSEPTFKGANYTYGVSVLAILPRGRGKWGIQNEVMYKPLQFEGTHEKQGNSVSQNIHTRTKTTFDMAFVGLNTLVRYNILNSKVKPYVVVGVANNFLISDNSIQEEYTKFYSTETNTVKKPFESVRKHEQALILGAGATISKFAAEFRIESGNGFSAYRGISTIKNTALFQLSYNFL